MGGIGRSASTSGLTKSDSVQKPAKHHAKQQTDEGSQGEADQYPLDAGNDMSNERSAAHEVARGPKQGGRRRKQHGVDQGSRGEDLPHGE
jgi:hypothetical protein